MNAAKARIELTPNLGHLNPDGAQHSAQIAATRAIHGVSHHTGIKLGNEIEID